MKIEKIKMRKIKPSTILAVGDIVFSKTFFKECTLLYEFDDRFLIRFDQTGGITCVMRYELEDHFLKML